MRWIVLAVLFMTPPAWSKTVKLSTDDGYAPYTGQKLSRGGMVTEIVQEVVSGMGHSVDLTWLPWRRGFEKARQAQFDGLFPYLKTADREKEFLFSEPLYEIRNTVFSLKGESGFYSSLESLKGKTYCLPLGWAPATHELAELVQKKRVKVFEALNTSTCAKMVNSGRADFFVTDDAQGEAALRETGLVESISLTPHLLPKTQLYFIISRSHPNGVEFVRKFNESLMDLKKSGSYEKIVLRHLRSETPAASGFPHNSEKSPLKKSYSAL
ncbi:substrate-binding periplasmic protein [Bdellovibrio bacteriovorus]|nr:transporter substrate-binding domain-containing protein [Bdellovibrio bacteriovorus]